MEEASLSTGPSSSPTYTVELEDIYCPEFWKDGSLGSAFAFPMNLAA